MAFPNPDCQFQAWVLTPQELEEGSLLTLTQVQVIQNQIAQLAQESINLILDPKEPYQYSLKQAENKGARDALQFMLEVSRTVEAVRNNTPVHTQTPRQE